MLSTNLTGPTAASGRSRARELPTIRAICFRSGGYEFALPMAVVLKVTHCPPLDNGDWSRSGLVYIDSQLIQVLDLALLLDCPERSPKGMGQFLVIARSGNTLCGLPTDSPPDSIDLPRDQVLPLPARFERSPLAHLAQCAVVLSPDTTPRTLFLLSLPQALDQANAVMGTTASSSPGSVS
ncbi:chemotaxis protein CheW [Limnothrix sp. FACHB-1083]|uniref:chemotaxis protein CheW n=1 Tax=unclassified Limnothrix TaxID=2632864 RepID=UPI00168079A6|nr:MULTISPECIES: chemotaxis protein CheW [unclassified Limnothrix]MBD2160305.1 chemotaxis protein CheW [Limnothrix sp. FACHB-1083]MBD2191007.1 chemotaxis protein CheW [Limnothrix sp. FACHB-1088]